MGGCPYINWLCVPETLVAFALQLPFWSVVRRHLYLQLAEITLSGNHSLALPTCEVCCLGSVLHGILFPFYSCKLNGNLQTDMQGL
jgi:hypothetical protein